MPTGFGENGLPTSIAFMGSAFGEQTLAAIGVSYQQKTDWHLRRPSGVKVPRPFGRLHEALRTILMLAVAAAITAGCNGDVGKQLASNELMRTQVFDALAANPQLAMQALDRVVRGDTLLRAGREHMLANDEIAKQVLVRIGIEPRRPRHGRGHRGEGQHDARSPRDAREGHRDGEQVAARRQDRPAVSECSRRAVSVFGVARGVRRPSSSPRASGRRRDVSPSRSAGRSI